MFTFRLNRYAHQLNRLKPHFQAAEDSFQQTIRPNAKNAELIRLTRAELVNIISSASASSAEDGSYLSVHIRRGDRKTASYSYPGRQVPIADFVQGVTDTWRRLDLKSDPFIYVASDSAAAQSELFELLPRHAVAAFSLSQSGDPEIRNLASPGEYIQHEFNMLEKEVRITATRGIIVDFALVSGMWAWENELIPDATVCTIRYANNCLVVGWEAEGNASVRMFAKWPPLGSVGTEHSALWTTWGPSMRSKSGGSKSTKRARFYQPGSLSSYLIRIICSYIDNLGISVAVGISNPP